MTFWLLKQFVFCLFKPKERMTNSKKNSKKRDATESVFSELGVNQKKKAC